MTSTKFESKPLFTRQQLTALLLPLIAEQALSVTIGLADGLGLPVSTTHVLASGVAGTMAAHKSGLQMRTLRSIAMAWVFTLPAAMLLGAGLVLLFSRLA